MLLFDDSLPYSLEEMAILGLFTHLKEIPMSELKELKCTVLDDENITKVLTVSTQMPIVERIGTIGGVKQLVGYERFFGFSNGLGCTVRFPKIDDSEPKTQQIFNFFGSINSGSKLRLVYKEIAKAEPKADTTPSGTKIPRFVAKGFYQGVRILTSTFIAPDYKSNYLLQDLPDFTLNPNIKVDIAWSEREKVSDSSPDPNDEIPF